MEYSLDYKQLASSISIPEIKSNCRFWMLRTKDGYFYQEFLKEGFVAIGWNIITADNLKEDDELLKLKIENAYPPNKKVPGNALNKCKRFICDLKKDDIILIVGSNEIAFAKIGEYYEDNNPAWTSTKELEVHAQIETKTSTNEILRCPYKKRRKIELIRKIPITTITPILYKVLAANRHSLSEIKVYKDAVLESCYEIFIYEKKLSLVFHIDQNKPIKSTDYITFIYAATKLIPAEVTIKSSIHSPGEIILSIVDYIQLHPSCILALWLVIFGGNFKDFEITSIASIASNLINFKTNKELKQLEVEEKKLEIEKKKIELEKEKLVLEGYLSQFSESAQNMNVRPVDSNVIDFDTIILGKDKNKNKNNNKI